MSATLTTCPYCGVGCGVRASARKDGGADIAGDAAHPASHGKLCVKGSALGDTVSLEGRLLHPMVDGQRTNWDTALDRVASGFRRIIDQHGPDAVAFYVSGQLLTEDYYVANKLMKGYVGSANIDTNSRLCMSSAVAGHKRAFGEDLVPICYEDFDLADLIVLVGSNTAWCHPIIFQRIVKARQQRPDMRIVVLDPRRTATCELADLHLPLRAGSDVLVFNGLLSYLHQHGIMDAQFVSAHTQGAAAAVAAADNTAGDVRAVAKGAHVNAQTLAEFYALFARSEKVITIFSQGVNQSSSGTDKVNSIINCHLLTGRIGKPGMGPFSVTGQPNAMGGREVGGLANMLAAHMEIGNPAHREIVQQFWGSPRIADKPGLKAVDLFEAVHAGKVKAVWIMATNPVVSMPDADRVRAALQKCELVVASDVLERTDTTQLAHVLLPAAAWGEKDGTVTNSERCISRQRAFLPMPGEARADWWALAEVGKRLGYEDAFNYNSAHQIFQEHARLSAFHNQGERCFDIGELAALDAAGYEALKPIQWPVREGKGRARLFEDGRYFHADGKARFIATRPRAPANLPDPEYPLVLNTGRIRDQWHTMTRTGRSAKLAEHLPEPYIDMHPQDALLSGARAGELVRVATRWGTLVARLTTSGDQPRGSVFVPIHWSGQFASDARVGALCNPAVDPISGEPEFKHTPVRVEAFGVDWHGFILSRRELDVDSLTWWTRIQGKQFLRYELGGRGRNVEWNREARRWLAAENTDADWLEYLDASARTYRAAHIVNGRIESCIFISPRPDLPSRAWLAGLFAKKQLAEEDRIGLLVGEPLNPQADAGPTVCSCFGVGRNTITQAIRLKQLKTPGEVTACLKAGGNCGSCVPELKNLIALCAREEAAAT